MVEIDLVVEIVPIYPKPHLEDCDIILDQIDDDDIYDIPPWELSSPSVNLKIHSTPKSEKIQQMYLTVNL